MWYERNVMSSVCILKVVKSHCDFECYGRFTDGFPKIKNIWIGGGWVG